MNSSACPIIIFFIASLHACTAAAAPIANWKEFNPNELVVPITGAGTDAPTFGDGTTENSSQAAWIAGMFGPPDSPQSVTLAVGETLTVSGQVVLTGGTNNSNQFRFGIFNDAGKFALGDGFEWAGGWLHSIGVSTGSDLWQGRTDGPFISTAGNAIDLNSTITRTGTFDGDSAAPFLFSMSVTRDSATTVDIVSLITGGDGDLSEQYVLEDVETTLFTYNANGWLFGGSSGLEQAEFSEVAFSVTGGGEARILAVRAVGSTVEIDYEGVEGRVYAIDASFDMRRWGDELDDSLSGLGTFVDDLASRFGDPLPTELFYRLREIQP